MNCDCDIDKEIKSCALCVWKCVYVCMRGFVWICVCVWESKRERKKRGGGGSFCWKSDTQHNNDILCEMSCCLYSSATINTQSGWYLMSISVCYTAYFVSSNTYNVVDSRREWVNENHVREKIIWLILGRLGNHCQSQSKCAPLYHMYSSSI